MPGKNDRYGFGGVTFWGDFLGLVFLCLRGQTLDAWPLFSSIFDQRPCIGIL